MQDIEEFKTVVRVVSQQGGWLVFDVISQNWVSQIDEMGWNFGYTEDDEGPTSTFPGSFPAGLPLF
jgi:hypothetical protein